MKKNKFFIAISFLSIIGNFNVNSQIVYTDVNPDTVIQDTYSYGLDLNNDGTNDFEFLQLTYGTDYMAEINSLNSNEGLQGATTYAPLAMNLNDPIGSAQSVWSVFSDSYLAQNSGPGDWSGVTDKYLGLRINIGGQWHYGWARLDVATSGASITLKDYAYESQPDVLILAGDKGTTAIETNSANLGFSVYFPTYKTLCVDSKIDLLPNARLIIYNIKGQNIIEVKLTNGNTLIDVSSFMDGVYLLKLCNGLESFSKKILL